MSWRDSPESTPIVGGSFQPCVGIMEQRIETSVISSEISVTVAVVLFNRFPLELVELVTR